MTETPLDLAVMAEVVKTGVEQGTLGEERQNVLLDYLESLEDVDMTDVTKKIWQELFTAFHLILKGAQAFPKMGKIRILNFISHKMTESINVTDDFLKHCNFPEMLNSEEDQIRD